MIELSPTIESLGAARTARGMTRKGLATVPNNDPMAYKEYQRRYRQAHREKRAAEHPDYDRVSHANQRAARYGVSERITVHDVRKVMAIGKCEYCGSTELLGIDHVIPLHAGGSNTLDNLVCCCRSCNASKGRADRPGKWAQEYDACVRCGSQSSKHAGHGLCNACYLKSRAS